VDLLERSRGLWSHLRRGMHHNKYLQRAWDRYREVNFEFKVLELLKPSLLLMAEQSWPNGTIGVAPSVGFNVSARAHSSGSFASQTCKGFFHPGGKPVAIRNLYDSWRQQRLDSRSMLRWSQGRSQLKSHPGWPHKKSVRKRDYVKTYAGFIKPDGR
jgi:hypothetical protein